jgi:hypothetical protein
MVTLEDLENDPELAKYYAMKRGMQFSHVERFLVRQSNEFGGFGYIAHVDIQLISIIPTEGRSIYLTFADVRDLTLRLKPLEEISFSALEIAPSGRPSYERVPYMVSDEDNVISFLCGAFTAEVK